ncbi:glutamate racemase [Anaerotruncus massiliensis (ex Liu et al. 2021)]|uniref:Glutamate racemase n=2 Tax=Anaerotruncus TaxID=244127 RepID=A0A498CKJ2_9FIRM|nr:MULTISPECIES: glutamate racemase [Anaerotruncus]MBC3939563.1 glutamate racemase [Anaerotruncus massiliensis (ex Togo et al. 2019)]RLL08715.1 glutamate racemase [Anaerotruncus massiliensis (ex Liu et al. 2021)]
MDNRAIGVFDSGLGGLTTVRELRKLLPDERIVYFGDTGRVPYGNRSRETIRKYAMQDIRFLKRHEVKLVIAACGTVSSALTPELSAEAGVPFSGVVVPAAQAACAATVNGRIGVIGTTATVRSGAYGRAIRTINPDARTFGNACPLFVPLVENGFIEPDNEITAKVAEIYLKPMIDERVDTLILGCTHYPLIYDIIDRALGSRVTLIDAGKQVARWAQGYLAREDLLAGPGGGGTEFYVSDSPDGFSEIAGLFLGGDVKGDVTQIDLDTL